MPNKNLYYFALLLALLTFSFSLKSDVFAQASRAVITASNADRLTELTIPPIDGISNVVWSPDGKTVILGGELGIWRARTETPLQPTDYFRVGFGDTAGFAQSPSGDLLAANNLQFTSILDAFTGEQRRALYQTDNQRSAPIAFSPDGKTLAIGDFDVDRTDGMVIIRNVVTGTLQATLDCNSHSVISKVAYSPDGSLLAVSLGSDLQVWSVVSGKIQFTLRSSNDLSTASTYYSAIAFSPDSRLLVTTNKVDGIQFWDPTTGEGHKIFSGDPIKATAVAFSPDGKTLVSGDINGHLQLWDLGTGKLRTTIKGDSNGITFINFSPDGKTLVSISWTTVHFWDIATSKQQASITNGAYTTTDLTFAPDGSLVTTGSFLGVQPGALRIWDTASFKVRAEFPSMAALHLTLSPDGKMVALGDLDIIVRLFSLGTGRQAPFYMRHNAVVKDMVFSADSSKLFTIDANGVLRAWDRKTGIASAYTLQGYMIPIAPNFSSVFHFNSDASMLFEGEVNLSDYDVPTHIVRAWSVPVGKLLTDFGRTSGSVLAIEVSRNQKLLAVASETDITLYDLTTGKVARVINDDEHIDYDSRSLAFSPDGNLLASAGRAGIIHIWDVTTGNTVGKPLPVTFSFYKIAFSPDGTLLVASDWITHFFGVK